MIIRTLEHEDIDQLLTLERSIFPKRHRWDEDDFNEYLDTRYSLGIVDETTDELIGYGAVQHLDKHKFYISNVGVSPEFQGKGYGKWLVETLIENIQSHFLKKTKLIITLDVRHVNKIAHALYEKIGFVDFKIKKHVSTMKLITQGNKSSRKQPRKPDSETLSLIIDNLIDQIATKPATCLSTSPNSQKIRALEQIKEEIDNPEEDVDLEQLIEETTQICPQRNRFLFWQQPDVLPEFNSLLERVISVRI